MARRLNVLNVSLLLLSSRFSARSVCADQAETWITRPIFAAFSLIFPLTFLSPAGRLVCGNIPDRQGHPFAIVIYTHRHGGSTNLSPRWLVFISRLIMNCVRTIPSLIWALLAVAIVGANPLAGVIGLTFYSVGYLGKFFSDAFESVHIDVARALRAAGARTIQAFQYGMWPHAKPLVWSYSLWMLEYNIRAASIVGIVGAGGVGLQLHTYQEYYQWDKFATVLLFMFLLVSVLDLLGERVRNQIVRKVVSAKAS
jgi:phosphonate ABC transporter permease subunit PhnE